MTQDGAGPQIPPFPRDGAPELMTGFPPAPQAQVTLANWQDPPFNRWAFQHMRELIPTHPIPAGPPAPLPAGQPLGNPVVARVDGSTTRPPRSILARTLEPRALHRADKSRPHHEDVVAQSRKTGSAAAIAGKSRAARRPYSALRNVIALIRKRLTRNGERQCKTVSIGPFAGLFCPRS